VSAGDQPDGQGPRDLLELLAAARDSDGSPPLPAGPSQPGLPRPRGLVTLRPAGPVTMHLPPRGQPRGQPDTNTGAAAG
jgi:hypothetical protein